MRISEKQKEILKIIGSCAIMTAAIIAPNVIQLLKPSNNRARYQYKKSIKKLFDNKIIYLFGEEIRLTDKGKKFLKKIEIDEIIIKKPKKWDNVWHLVCYDIPEDKKKERDYFRHRIAKLGFVVIQDSLWVLPHECKEEIAVISQSLGVSPFVAYLNTNYLPQQEKLIDHFELKLQKNGSSK